MTEQEAYAFLSDYMTDKSLAALVREVGREKMRKGFAQDEALPEITGLLKKIVQSFKKLPELNATDTLGDEARVRAHYYGDGLDVYVTELEKETKEGFGLTIREGELEPGYISLDEILNDLKLDLDLNCPPRLTLALVKRDYLLSHTSSLLKLSAKKPAQDRQTSPSMSARPEQKAEGNALPAQDVPLPQKTPVTDLRTSVHNEDPSSAAQEKGADAAESVQPNQEVKSSLEQILSANTEVLMRWAVKVLSKTAEERGKEYLLKYDSQKQKFFIDLHFAYEQESLDPSLLLIDSLTKAPIRPQPFEEKEIARVLLNVKEKLKQSLDGTD